MKIAKVRFARLQVPLVTPFKTALRTVDHIHDLVVLVETDDGQIGFGAAPSTPVITGDTHDSIKAAIEQVIAPQITGMAIADIDALCRKIQGAMVNNTSAKAALEIACYDLWGKLHQAPLYQLLGGGKPSLETDITISVDNIDKMLSDCQLAIDQGFKVLKIKIGKDIVEDIARVKAIYKAVGEQVILRLDVNQGWTAKQTVFAMTQLEQQGVNLELIEQPVKAADIAGMAYICERINTPVMADESAFSATQVISLFEQRAADIINIKLMKSAGISNAIKIAEIAALKGIPCMMGCMLEGSIGVAAAAHVAVAKSAAIPLVDLDGPALGRYDPVQGGVDFNKAHIRLSQSPGLGIQSIDGLTTWTGEPLTL